jgi:DNA-binding NtrC family response regulator
MRVGSAKVQKTDVRVVAATNNNLLQSIAEGRFREDLYYRLNTVPIMVPALRERKGDIYLLFRKFASDVALQYRMPAITLDEAARAMLENYHWRGNIRQLKNVAEQISAIEQRRDITSEVLRRYLPDEGYNIHPVNSSQGGYNDLNERELLYKVLFDMRNDINELKRMMTEAMTGHREQRHEPSNIRHDVVGLLPEPQLARPQRYDEGEVIEVYDEPARELTKDDVQREQILKALRNNGFIRKDAARELFISERTLYRRRKALGIDDNTK